MSILLIAGSPSWASRSSRLLAHLGTGLAELGHRIASVEVIRLPAEALLHAHFKHPEILAAGALVEQARAVIVATPVYKAAYSGVLKAFLDLLPQDGLRGKLALPLATGGSQSHMLALDYALRPVLAALGARHVLPSIYATEDQVRWSDDDGLTLDAGIARRLDEAIDALDAGLRASAGHQAGTASFVPFADIRCSV
ncbi:FMN reductase [Noviherbaspirillum humi]|uniref:FMN reductase n=1 Tax=Noviherbaspirillum humi TaxID=1688639 RepID=A0A239G6E7_9BURK|nr:NADPH-dependent FMN reductase [Noviherbaspirillum humi]SNS64033.1 FMN reductase [Noviherbaspirillum humi]